MKKLYFLLGGVSAIALLIVGLASASAFGGPANGTTGQSAQGTNRGQFQQRVEDMQAHRAEMQDLMETATYDEWKAAVEEHAASRGNTESPRILQEITADNFDQFKQMHELMQAGDKDGAKAIADELGLTAPEGRGGMMGHRGGMMGHRGGMMGGDRGQFKDTNGDGVCDRADVEEETVPIQS